MDLKLKDVAALLNLSEKTIKRFIVERKIPVYRLQDEYLFSRVEIEDWMLQHKLDFTAECENEQVDGSLHFNFYRALYRGDVLTFEDPIEDKQAVMFRAMEWMACHYNFDQQVLTELLMDREKLMPTSVGKGFALPHARDFLLDTHFDVMMVVYLNHPIEWGAFDHHKVHTLFFLFACDDRHHLNLLSKVAYLLSHERAKHFLASKPKKPAMLEYVKDWESNLDH